MWETFSETIRNISMDDLKPSPFHMYRLYFKGFVNEETKGFGVAICDQEDKLLFHIKGSCHHDSAITVLEAEFMALKRGLTEAVGLGINHISFYCDHAQIFELVSGISMPEQENIALLLYDVTCIREQLRFNIPVLMTRNKAKFANKLALETIVSEINIDMSSQRKTCRICFDDDFKAEQMFHVALCGHQFCVECVKRHIEVKLREGGVPKCPHYQCESKLSFTSCANLLIPKVRKLWERRIKMESTSVADRVYCPNPTRDDIQLRDLANQNMLGQCRKCQHMNEFSSVLRVTCRCGYKFCYICGAEWKRRGGCGHRGRIIAEDHTKEALGVCAVVMVFVGLMILSSEIKR